MSINIKSKQIKNNWINKEIITRTQTYYSCRKLFYFINCISYYLFPVIIPSIFIVIHAYIAYRIISHHCSKIFTHVMLLLRRGIINWLRLFWSLVDPVYSKIFLNHWTIKLIDSIFVSELLDCSWLANKGIVYETWLFHVCNEENTGITSHIGNFQWIVLWSNFIDPAFYLRQSV